MSHSPTRPPASVSGQPFWPLVVGAWLGGFGGLMAYAFLHDVVRAVLLRLEILR